MVSTERERIRVMIRGRVQGVFFRAATREEAARLNVTGWVRNLPDGGVEVLAEGDPRPLKDLIAWCRQGPTYARVTHVEIFEEPYTGEFDSFQTRY